MARVLGTASRYFDVVAITLATVAMVSLVRSDGFFQRLGCGGRQYTQSQLCCIGCDGRGTCAAAEAVCPGALCTVDNDDASTSDTGMRINGDASIACGGKTCASRQICCLDCGRQGSCLEASSVRTGYACIEERAAACSELNCGEDDVCCDKCGSSSCAEGETCTSCHIQCDENIVCLCRSTAPQQGYKLTHLSPEQFFITPGERAVLAWSFVPDGDGTPPCTLRYTVYSYWDEAITSGEAPVVDGKVRATLRLPPGFYSLRFEGNDDRFGLLVAERFQGKTDPFFGIDSAMSWLVVRKNRYASYDNFHRTREGLVQILARSGVAMSRERVNWNAIESRRGRWSWDTSRQYDTLRRTYKANNVEVLEVFHHSPGWISTIAGSSYPSDLIATSESWRTIANRWKLSWGAFEVWNEPNLLTFPADQYVSLVKTIAYTLHQIHSDLSVSGGVIGGSVDKQFLEVAAANGLFADIDVLSFHTYAYALNIKKMVADYRLALNEYNHGSMPLWITESGRPFPVGTDRPLLNNGLGSALDIAMKAIEARACGIERYFPFVFPYLEERVRNFSMMDRFATPLRSMAVYTQAIQLLSHRTYLGDWRHKVSDVLRARVFGDEDNAVLVLYTSQSKENNKIAFDIPASAEVYGADGRKLEKSPGQVPIPDGLTYVTMSRNAAEPHLIRQTPAMELYQLAQQTAPEKKILSSPVVLQFLPDPDYFSANADGYRLANDNATAIPFSLQVVNLSEKPYVVSVRLVRGNEQLRNEHKVRIAPRGSSLLEWRIPFKEMRSEAKVIDLKVYANSTSVDRISPAMIRIVPERTVEDLLKQYDRKQELPFDDESRWNIAAAAKAEGRINIPRPGVWELRVKFNDAPDRWVYPRLSVPSYIDLSQYDGFVIEARCDQQADVGSFLLEKGKVGYLTKGIVPADGKWHTAFIPFSSYQPFSNDLDGQLDLEQVSRISFGMNSKVADNVLQLREVWLVGQRVPE